MIFQKWSFTMIEIDNLHKKFGANQVLQGINLSLSEPGITAIVGPNGSGKTTLIKCILGMTIPDSGTIYFGQEDTKGEYKYRHSIAHMPQIAHFPENLTARELIRMIHDLRSETSTHDEMCELFKLEQELDKKMSDLSGGTKQKVNFVVAMMHDVPVIILDEPTASLDPLALIHLKKTILDEKARGKQILITTHIMSFVEEVADNIIFLLEGNIYFNGPLKDLLKNNGEEKLEKAIAKILEEHTN
jgi:Cu-processing system ATP-binding protein